MFQTDAVMPVNAGPDVTARTANLGGAEGKIVRVKLTKADDENTSTGITITEFSVKACLKEGNCFQIYFFIDSFLYQRT